jgi:hypothetical protein
MPDPSSFLEGTMPLDLVDLIESNVGWLVDEITKDAIRQVPLYGKAPIRQTMARTEMLLNILAESVRRKRPALLEQFLEGVAEERFDRGYPIAELHSILDITEKHIHDLIAQPAAGEMERAAQDAALRAVIDSAHMAFSKAYMQQAKGAA